MTQTMTEPVPQTVQVLHRTSSAQAMEAPVQKRVAAYCRVSTDLEEQQSSLDTQMTAFREQICRRPDWKLAGIYADEGVTGTSVSKRTEFLRMIADCEDGKVDYIITKSISRFARNTLECLSYVRRLKELGVYVLFVKENIDTATSTSEVVLSVLAAIAQEESHSISENLKWSNRKRFAAGTEKWSATYGYIRDKDGTYIIDGERGETVRRIYDLYVKGVPMSGIVQTLKDEGVPSAKNATWCVNTIARILGNEKYVGDIMMQKTYTIDHLTHDRVQNDQTVVPSYYIRDHHTPIVDRKTYDMVQLIRKLKDQHQGSTQYPYHGFLFCPECGNQLRRTKLPVSGSKAAWGCNDGEHACRSFALKELYIHEALLEAYSRLDVVDVRRRLASRNADVVRAALEMVEMKEQMVQPETVEYYWLDALVDRVVFEKGDGVNNQPTVITAGTDKAAIPKGERPIAEKAAIISDRLVVHWKCGLTSSGQLRYQRMGDMSQNVGALFARTVMKQEEK